MKRKGLLGLVGGGFEGGVGEEVEEGGGDTILARGRGTRS